MILDLDLHLRSLSLLSLLTSKDETFWGKVVRVLGRKCKRTNRFQRSQVNCCNALIMTVELLLVMSYHFSSSSSKTQSLSSTLTPIATNLTDTTTSTTPMSPCLWTFHGLKVWSFGHNSVSSGFYWPSWPLVLNCKIGLVVTREEGYTYR